MSPGRRDGRRRSRSAYTPPEDAAGNPAKLSDARGARLSPALQDAFNDLLLPEVLQMLKDIARKLLAAGKTNKWLDPEWLLERPFNTLAGYIAYRQPFVVHDECGGEGCIDCKSTGFLTEEAVEALRMGGRSESEA
jgi:hypothetical protein